MSRIVTNANKKNTIKKVSEWVFSGFSIFFIGMLVFMAVHDTMTSQSSNTAEYCAKYGFLASPVAGSKVITQEERKKYTKDKRNHFFIANIFTEIIV